MHTDFNPNCATCHGPNAPVCVECHDEPSDSENLGPGFLAHDFRGGPGAPSHDFHLTQEGDCSFCHKSEVPDPGPVREPYTNSCAPCHAFNGPGDANHDLHTVTGTPNLPPITNCATCHGPEAPVCSECHQQENHDFRFGPGAEGHDFHTDSEQPPDLPITNCETCHLSGVPDVTPIHEVGNIDCTGCHYTNLLPQHESDCGLCHGSTSSTVEDAIADGTIECQACHGGMPHAMECMLCHNDQNYGNYWGSDSRRIHDEHMDKTACGVCHEIPSNTPRQSCGLCHSSRSIDSARSVHKKHLRRFDNVARPCFWCHGLETPTTPDNVCDLCHSGRSGDRVTAHKRHGDDFLCTVCHDNVAGFGFDVRTGTPRDEVCTACHTVRNDDFREVHEEHLDEAQCFTCHGRSNVYAKLRGNLDCSICHGYENDSFRKVHREHVGDGTMCAVCHSVAPPSVQGVDGENSIPGYGTQPETEPGPPTPGPGEGLDDGYKDSRSGDWGSSYDGWRR